MEKEEKERQRKANIKRGQLTQKMVNFRADLETIEVLNEQPNKGRFLNDLVKAWAVKNRPKK